jgi:hypothetical protein
MKILLIFAVLSILATLFAVGLVRGGKGPARTTRRPDLEADGERRRAVPGAGGSPAATEAPARHRESAEDR